MIGLEKCNIRFKMLLLVFHWYFITIIRSIATIKVHSRGVQFWKLHCKTPLLCRSDTLSSLIDCVSVPSTSRLQPGDFLISERSRWPFHARLMVEKNGEWRRYSNYGVYCAAWTREMAGSGTWLGPTPFLLFHERPCVAKTFLASSVVEEYPTIRTKCIFWATEL
jgi:hypothetical protein